MQNLRVKDLKNLIDYIKNFYTNQEEQLLIGELGKIVKDNINDEKIKLFSRRLIQFFFSSNFIILKSSSPNSIRHYLSNSVPDNIRDYKLFINKFLEFFNLLKRLFKIIEIDIEIVNSYSLKEEIPDSPLYFYFKNIKSVFKFLLYWDSTWTIFPNDKIEALKEFFKDFETYLYFDKRFLNKIYGTNGIINKNHKSTTGFFKEIFNLSNYKRHAVYKWRDNNYFPISVVIDIYKSKYSTKLDKNFLRYIEYIKIGKSQQIDKELLKQLQLNYQNSLYRFIIPPDSFLGYLLNYIPSPEEFNVLAEYNNKFLKEYDMQPLRSLILESEDGTERQSFDDFLNFTKEKIFRVRDDLYIKELKIKNFKSYVDETIQFQKGINILWGLNSSGKTTIFDAIFFALFIPTEFRSNFRLKNLDPLKLDFLDTFYIHKGRNQCEVSLVLSSNEKDITIVRKLSRDGKHQIFIDNKDIFDEIRFKDNVLRKKIGKFLHDKGGIDFEIWNMVDRIEIEAPDIDDGTFTSRPFSYIIEAINQAYKDNNCFFEIGDIFSSFYLEFKSIFNFFMNPSPQLKEFYLEKLDLMFLNNIIENVEIKKKYFGVKIGENLSEIVNFLKSSEEFLYNKYLDYINTKFSEFSKDCFKEGNFTSFLDEYGLPLIKFNDTKDVYPINVLSGAEKSKLILVLLSVLISISNKTSFYIIDEPNEILDPNNTEIMKQFFFKLFNKKQLIISTFIENYKNFQPALIYEIWKDHNNRSHVLFLDDKKKLKLYKELDEIENKFEQNPKDSYYIQRKLGLLIRLNRYEEALDFYYSIKDLNLDVFDDAEHLDELLIKIKNLEKDTEKSKEDKSKFYWIKALLFYYLKETNNAIENVDEAMKLGINIPDVYDFKAHNLYLRNKPKEALKTIEEGIRLFPNFMKFHKTKSAILEILGKYEGALFEIGQSIKIDKENEWNYYQKAKILYKLERFLEALENINKALEQDPHDPVYIQDKINILESLNRVDEAIELLEKEKDNQAQPELTKAQLYQTKSHNLAKVDQEEEAIETIKKAIKIDPEEADFYNTYGEILMNFKQYEEAVKQFKIAKKLHFTPIQTYINMGKCLYELGRYEDALENFKKGRNVAAHSVKKETLTKDDKRTIVDDPQMELIKESDNYISKIEEKLKK